MEYTDGVFAIRRYQAQDVHPLYEAARESIDQIYPWMEWCHPRFSMKDSTAWVMSRDHDWNTGTEYSFVIIDATTRQFLGGCGINGVNRGHRFANLGYWIRTSATRKGAATAASKLLARFGFEELKLIRIEIVVAIGNKASERVAEKLGALREGILRRRLMIGTKAHDATMFSLAPQDIF